MNRRGTGIIFIVISAFLISIKYLSAAIFGSGVSSWSVNLFQAMLNYVGDTLSNFSVLALILGIAYIVWGEIDAYISSKKEN
jgi:hypothetical protein